MIIRAHQLQPPGAHPNGLPRPVPKPDIKGRKHQHPAQRKRPVAKHGLIIALMQAGDSANQSGGSAVEEADRKQNKTVVEQGSEAPPDGGSGQIRRCHGQYLRPSVAQKREILRTRISPVNLLRPRYPSGRLLLNVCEAAGKAVGA